MRYTESMRILAPRSKMAAALEKVLPRTDCLLHLPWWITPQASRPGAFFCPLALRRNRQPAVPDASAPRQGDAL